MAAIIYLYHNIRKLDCRNTALMLQGNPPGVCASMYLIGQWSWMVLHGNAVRVELGLVSHWQTFLHITMSTLEYRLATFLG